VLTKKARPSRRGPGRFCARKSNSRGGGVEDTRQRLQRTTPRWPLESDITRPPPFQFAIKSAGMHRGSTCVFQRIVPRATSARTRRDHCQQSDPTQPRFLPILIRRIRCSRWATLAENDRPERAIAVPVPDKVRGILKAGVVASRCPTNCNARTQCPCGCRLRLCPDTFFVSRVGAPTDCDHDSGVIGAAPVQ